MAFTKHCGGYATTRCHQASHQSANCPGAPRRRQAPHRAAIDPAQRRDTQPSRALPRPAAPAHRSQRNGLGVAGRGESGRQERQRRPRPRRATQVSHPVRRTGHQRPKSRRHQQAPTAAQMLPRTHRPGQCAITSHHQLVPPRPAQPRQIARQNCACRVRIMAQHHPAQARRQARHRPPWIGQPRGIGEQPQHRQRRAQPLPGLDRTCPSDKPFVHDRPPPRARRAII